MRKLVYLLFLLTFGLAQQPEFKVSSFNLLTGETLEVTANNLGPNSRYALTLSTPEGALFRENPRSDMNGSLTYKRVLDSEGEWSIRLKGDDIDTQLFVTVTLEAQNPLAEGIANTPENPLSQTESAQSAEENPAPLETQDTEATQTQETNPETNPNLNVVSQPDSGEQETNEAIIQSTQTEVSPTDENESGQVTSEPQTTETETTQETPLTQVEDTESTQSVTEPDQMPAETEPLTSTVPEPEEQSLQNVESEVTEAEPQEVEASELAPADATLSSVSLENGALRAQNWTLEFPEGSGQIQGLIEHNNAVYGGHGNSLLKLDAQGNIVQRWILSGQIKDVTFAGKNLEVITDIGHGLSETFSLEDDQIVTPVRFSNQPEVFSFLKNEAKVTDPVMRLTQDATNPWLYVESAKSAASSAEARASFEQAVDKASTFYDLAGISRELLASGNTDLADHAFDKALKDFAARGYDPRLLTDMKLHEAYNFPLQPLKDALREQNMDHAAFWAKWLRYFSSSNTPEVQQTLSNYADVLATKGQRTEALLWRSYARAGRQTGIGNLLDNIMTSIGRLGWYGVISLLIGLVGLALTLLFKYWEPHSLLTRRRQAAQKSTQPWARLWAVRHYSFTEKLFVVLVLASILALAALANWNEKGKDVANLEAFTTGTLANGLASSTASSLPDNPRSSFIRGYAAQVSGDIANAKTLYEQAGNFAPAINNLAVLSNDTDLYKRALELSPGLAEARINQGQQVGQLPFAEYTAGQILAIPTRTDVQTALADNWQNAIASMFTNPWLGLQNVRPGSIPTWLWYILQTLFLILCAVSLLWLFIPRPRVSRNAPRNLAYHVLSLLIPGSGLADEIWGILLLIPWAFIGLDVLSQVLGWGLDLGLSFNWGLIALGVIYLINTIAFLVELASYQKRMKQLKQTNPDLAREFGMRVRA